MSKYYVCLIFSLFCLSEDLIFHLIGKDPVLYLIEVDCVTGSCIWVSFHVYVGVYAVCSQWKISDCHGRSHGIQLLYHSHQLLTSIYAGKIPYQRKKGLCTLQYPDSFVEPWDSVNKCKFKLRSVMIFKFVVWNFLSILTLRMLVATIDALGHF